MKKVKTKKILSALILAALVISLLPAASLPARADDKGNIVIPGSGTITQAIVNTALAGAGVGVGDTYTASFSDSPTAIGDNAFDLRTGLTGITFPASLQSIGDYAFISCASLTSITLPDGLQSIGKGAFSWCGLTSINIPQSVTAVDAELFWGSTDLANITVDSGSQYYMHIDGVLFSKNGETLVCYPAGKTAVSYLIPAGVETIGPYAFSYSAALKSVDFSASDVSVLGDSAFARSGLTSISLPDSLKSIGSAAFEDCTDLQSVTIPGGLESIGVAAFRDCTGLTDIFMMPIVAPALVTSAFNNLPATAVVHARRGATGYDDTAWSGITVRHDLPENLPVIFLDGEGGEVTQAMADAALDGAPDEYAVAVYNADSIGAEAFMGQNGMWELVIAEGVTDIGDRAFWNCRDLVSMFFHGAPPTLGSEVFDYCPANMTL